jgi:hypothetical protein
MGVTCYIPKYVSRILVEHYNLSTIVSHIFHILNIITVASHLSTHPFKYAFYDKIFKDQHFSVKHMYSLISVFIITSVNPVHNAPVKLPPPPPSPSSPVPPPPSERFFNLAQLQYPKSATTIPKTFRKVTADNFPQWVFSGAKVAELRHTQSGPDPARHPFLTSAIPGLRFALECRNLISSNSFALRLGTGNSALRLAPGPVGLKPELRQGRSEFIYKIELSLN